MLSMRLPIITKQTKKVDKIEVKSKCACAPGEMGMPGVPL